MKRCFLCIIVILALLFVPAEHSDVGRLLPVELLEINVMDGQVCIRTDTQNTGVGKDVASAYEDMSNKAAAQIYLDTAEYLVLTGEGEMLIPELREYLKGNIRVCTADARTDIKEAAVYLSEHKPKLRLKDARRYGYMEHLSMTDNGFLLQ